MKRERQVPEPRRVSVAADRLAHLPFKNRLKNTFQIIHAFRSRQRSRHLISVKPFLAQEGLKSQFCSVKCSAVVICGCVDPVPSH